MSRVMPSFPRVLPQRRTTLRRDADAAELQPLNAMTDDGPSIGDASSIGKSVAVLDDMHGKKKRQCRFTASKLFLLIAVLEICYLLVSYSRTHPTERVFASSAAENAYCIVLLGLALICVVLNFMWAIWAGLIYPCTRRCDVGDYICPVFLVFFRSLVPLAIPLWLHSAIEAYTWNHSCDGQTMQVVLTARAFSDPLAMTHAAHFYGRDYPYPLFTYTLDDQNQDDLNFKLLRFDVPRAEIPENLIPWLQEIRYNLTASTMTGTCSEPARRDCLRGSFIPGSSFFITDNTTTAAHELRVMTRGWQFAVEAPAITVMSTNANGSLDDVVFKTAILKPDYCTSMKVCIPHGAVDSAVLAPLGLVLKQQAEYAMKCTAPAH